MDEKLIKSEDNEAINTPQELIDSTIDKVTKILDEYFPNYLIFGNGSFTISRGSTQVMIVVRPYTDDDTCIECISNVVVGARIDEELMRFLLRKNAELHFGAFGLLFDDTITFSHSISGKNIDSNELENTLNAVATISDYFDDIIVDLAGGYRASDNVNDLEKD